MFKQVMFHITGKKVRMWTIPYGGDSVTTNYELYT